MEDLKPGDVLVKGEKEITVIDTSKNGKLIFHKDVPFADTWSTVEKFITQGWTKKEEPWMPKVGENYFFVSSNLDVEQTENTKNSTYDEKRLAFGNCFPTESAALAAREKIISVLKGK